MIVPAYRSCTPVSPVIAITKTPSTPRDKRSCLTSASVYCRVGGTIALPSSTRTPRFGASLARAARSAGGATTAIMQLKSRSTPTFAVTCVQTPHLPGWRIGSSSRATVCAVAPAKIQNSELPRSRSSRARCATPFASALRSARDPSQRPVRAWPASPEKIASHSPAVDLGSRVSPAGKPYQCGPAAPASGGFRP